MTEEEKLTLEADCNSLNAIAVTVRKDGRNGLADVLLAIENHIFNVIDEEVATDKEAIEHAEKLIEFCKKRQNCYDCPFVFGDRKCVIWQPETLWRYEEAWKSGEAIIHYDNR